MESGFFYLLRQSPSSVSSGVTPRGRSSPFGQSGALWSTDFASGRTQQFLSGFTLRSFDLSREEKEVIFTTEDSQIWLAPLDRRSPPRMLTRGGPFALFGRAGEIIFVAQEEKQNFLYRMKADGTGRERITDTPLLGGPWSTSPDGEWVVALVPVAGQESNWETVAFSTHGAQARRICPFFCRSRWSADGRYLYLDVDVSGSSPAGRTFAVPLQPGRFLPEFPDSAIKSPADLVKLAGVRVIGRSDLFPGPDPAVYVFSTKGFHANLFRVVLDR